MPSNTISLFKPLNFAFASTLTDYGKRTTTLWKLADWWSSSRKKYRPEQQGPKQPYVFISPFTWAEIRLTTVWNWSNWTGMLLKYSLTSPDQTCSLFPTPGTWDLTFCLLSDAFHLSFLYCFIDQSKLCIPCNDFYGKYFGVSIIAAYFYLLATVQFCSFAKRILSISNNLSNTHVTWTVWLTTSVCTFIGIVNHDGVN